MLFSPVAEISYGVHRPSVAPSVAICSSVTVPSLVCKKSVSSSSSGPGTIAHNQGPFIFGPPRGKPGFSYQRILVFSGNPPKGDISDILLWARFIHFKLCKEARGETSDTLLRCRSRRFNLRKDASGEISNI